MKLNRDELIWASGFYDGDGTLCKYIDGRDTTPRLVLSISQKDNRPLIRFKNAFNNWGNIHQKNVNDIYGYSCYRFDRIQQMCILMWPYLCNPKKEQISIKLNEFVDAWNLYPWKRITYHMGENTFWRPVK